MKASPLTVLILLAIVVGLSAYIINIKPTNGQVEPTVDNDWDEYIIKVGDYVSLTPYLHIVYCGRDNGMPLFAVVEEWFESTFAYNIYYSTSLMLTPITIRKVRGINQPVFEMKVTKINVKYNGSVTIKVRKID